MEEIAIPIQPDNKKCRTAGGLYPNFLLVSWDDSKGKSKFSGRPTSDLGKGSEVFHNVHINDSVFKGGLPAPPFVSYRPLSQEQALQIDRCFDESDSESDFYQRVRSLAPLGAMKYAFSLRPPRVKDVSSDGLFFPGANATQQLVIGPRVIPNTKSFGIAIRGEIPVDINKLADALEEELSGLNYGGVLLMGGKEREFGPNPYSGKIRFRWDVGGDSTTEGMFKALVSRHKNGDVVGAMGLGFDIWYRSLCHVGFGTEAGILSKQFNNLRKGKAVDVAALAKFPGPVKDCLKYGF